MTGRRRLIVNADGFGFGSGATQGIIDAIREGRFISSVSVNANFPEVERVRDLISEFPHISIGVHLNPMAGKPCLPAEQVPSLVGNDGCLLNHQFPRLLRQQAVSLVEMEAEFDAQISRVKELAGDRLTHIDSQGNQHLAYFDLFLKLARRWEIPRMRNNASLICLEAPNAKRSRLKVYSRKPHVWAAHRYRQHQMQKARGAGMRMADRLVTLGYAGVGNKGNIENWKRVLKNLSAGTYEIYCHPAYPDETLHRWSTYYDDRARELAILRKKELCDMARAAGVEIISFDAI
ncbi:MAG: ChbG/HpnK family deacetylase [Deltaproteobacteria bacterium]|nr:ChbG/HpnK family deacetylase [Deltaproteobacteria bacterium]